MITALHFADQHLAASGDRIDRETGLSATLVDRYRCSLFAVNDGIARGAQIVLSCGDLLCDHVAQLPRPTPDELYYARLLIQAATGQDLPWVEILGNHPSPGALLHKHALEPLRGIEGLTIVDRPCLLDVWETMMHGLEVSPAATENERKRGDTTCLQLACLPWPNKALLFRDADTRQLSPDDLNLLIREKMMEIARGLAAQRRPGVPGLLLGHFAVDTAEAGSQNSLAMLSSEWTMNVHELAALGFDGVLLGHYHRPQELHQQPLIAYSGSPEATSFGEQGEAKSYLLWHIPDDGNCRAEPIETPYRRLQTLGPQDFDEQGELRCPHVMPSELAGAIVRLQIPAAMKDMARKWRAACEVAGAQEVRVEIERAEVVKRRESQITASASPTEALDAWLATRADLSELADDLRVEATRVEEWMAGGGA